MKHSVVTATRCPLMGAPAWESEQTDELLLGWQAAVLERPAPGWSRVRSSYGYEGFAPDSALRAEEGRSAAFAALPKQVVTAGFCAVLAQPRVQSWPVAELTRGALVAPLGGSGAGGWLRVALPDGGSGYTKGIYLRDYCENARPGEAEFRRAVVRDALRYQGSCYRWGGKSPLGIDCSGLAFMAYWLNGVTIFRDARIDPAFPIREIPAPCAKEGDLLYFPGHVALCLGGGRYVHANARDGGVSVNSLDPAARDYRDDLAQSLLCAGSLF